LKFDLNPVQKAALPHVERDVNVVVSSPTGSGKTYIAELVFEHLLSRTNLKAAYVAPLKSLSLQKHEEWSSDERFQPYRSVASTSDNWSGREDLEASRLLVMTLESLDAKTRNPSHLGWIERVGCLVIDEAHTIGSDGRGDRLEAAMMRFTQLNGTARLILLSGTMENADQIASWVKSLNGKDTVKIASKWRPCKVKVNMVEVPQAWGERLEAVHELLQEGRRGDKTIVFVHSKKLGKDIVRLLREKGVRCAFHNAGLSRGMRSKIEQTFNSQISGMDVLVSTSTLSAGINLGM
jgi:replicative superfamily II helicase